MATPGSGLISLNDCNVAGGRASGTAISMNDEWWRIYFGNGVASGGNSALSWAYGKPGGYDCAYGQSATGTTGARYVTYQVWGPPYARVRLAWSWGAYSMFAVQANADNYIQLNASGYASGTMSGVQYTLSYSAPEDQAATYGYADTTLMVYPYEIANINAMGKSQRFNY